MGCVPNTQRNYGKNTISRRSNAFNGLTPRADTLTVSSSRVRGIPLPQQSRIQTYSRNTQQGSPMNYSQSYGAVYNPQYNKAAQAYGLIYTGAVNRVIEQPAVKVMNFSPESRNFRRTNSYITTQSPQAVVSPPPLRAPSKKRLSI